jgi:uncharacterized membrane protein YGL010W
MGKPLQNWLSRHRNPTNFWIHMFAIPLTFLVPPVLIALGHWMLAGAMFLAGYSLQFLGHIVEGNRSGEEMLVRKILGRGSSDNSRQA